MAMAVLKQGPPPSGGGKLKPPKNTSEMQRLVSQAVVDMSAVKAKLPPVNSIKELEEWELHQRLKLLSGGSSTGGGGGEDKTWYPKWTYDDSQPALWNLLWNAEIMTPVKSGRNKFTPDPNYNGDGISPPQKSGMHCPVQWDNVVDFETALIAAKQSAVAKSNHSARSRGYPNLLDEDYQRSFKEDQETERIVQQLEQDSYSRDWGELDPAYFTRKWVDSEELDISAFEMGGEFEAWNDEEDYTTTLVGDTTDSHMSCMNISISAAMAFHQCKRFVLSYSCLAAVHEGEVWLYRFDSDIHSDHYVVKRMPELDFYYTLEEADTYFSLSDNVFSPDGDSLTDWAVDQIFKLNSVGGEFRSWHTSELMQLWMEENHQATQRDAHREYLDTYNEIVEPSYAELRTWLHEYKAFHQKVIASYRKPQPYEYKQARECQPSLTIPIQSWMTDEVWRHGSEWRKYDQLLDDHYNSGTQTSSQSYTETEDLQASGVGKFSGLSYEDWWTERETHDSLRYHSWLVKYDVVTAALDEDRMSEGSLSQYLPRTFRFMDSVPVYMELFKKYESPIDKLKGWISKKVNRFNSWLDEPIFKFGKSRVTQQDHEEVQHFIDEETARTIADRIIAEGTAHDDAYDLAWLDKSLPITKHDVVAQAVKRFMNEKPKEMFSEEGIFLGRELVFPQMQDTGLIVLSDQEGSTLEDSSSILLPR